MGEQSETELERGFFPVYSLVRSILYSRNGKKSTKYSKTQMAALAALYWHRELRMSQIAELVSSTREQMTRAINPLVEDGLVERFSDGRNRKQVYVRLTEEGFQYVRQFLKERFYHIQEKLSENDAARFTDATRTIVEILSKLYDGNNNSQ